MAINHGRKHFERVLIFRPHNVYGPDMGFDHVIPQFALRLKRAIAAHAGRRAAVRDPRQRRGDAQLLPRRRSGGGRDDHARARRAPRHLPCRHHRGDHHRRSCPPHGRALQAREIALRAIGGAGGQHARGAAPIFRNLRALGYRASRSARCRACRRRSTGIGRTSTWRRSAEAADRTGELPLFPDKVARAAGTGASVPVECCQVCGHAPLDDVLSLGYMPPVNQMVPIGEVPRQQPWFPTNLLHCRNCELVQLGLAVDPVIIFPPEYPYTSGTTKLLRDNFAELYREASAMLRLGAAGPRRRYRLERRHAAFEFQGRRPPRARHRADRRRQDRRRAAASRRSMRYFTPAVAARGEARAWPGAGSDGGELLCPHRGRACDRRGHPRSARARRRVHFRVALPHRAARSLAIRHHLSRAPALLFAATASPICCRCTGSRCSTRGRSRATAARSASMRRGAARSRCSDSVGEHARRRAARRRDARAARAPSATT